MRRILSDIFRVVFITIVWLTSIILCGLLFIIDKKWLITLAMSSLTITAVSYVYIPWARNKLNSLGNELKLDIEIGTHAIKAIGRAVKYISLGFLAIAAFIIIAIGSYYIFASLAELPIKTLLVIILMLLIFILFK